MGEKSHALTHIRNAEAADLAVVQQISADAYIGAYVAVLGYIPQPAEEDYSTRIARHDVWIIERDGHAVGVAVLEARPDHLLVFADQRAVAIGVPEIRLFTNTGMTRNIAYTAATASSKSASGRTRTDQVNPLSTWPAEQTRAWCTVDNARRNGSPLPKSECSHGLRSNGDCRIIRSGSRPCTRDGTAVAGLADGLR